LFDESASRSLIIQYGGSVKPENAVSLLSQDGVDGALIGGASLNAAEFIAIIHSANEQPQAEGKSA
jgi:triosephosphate isomerase